MNQDQLIQALVNHLDPDAVLEAKRTGTMYSYYVTLAQNILGNNAQTQTNRKNGNTGNERTRPARNVVVDLNETETNETERPARETTRPATNRQPARTNAGAGDRVGVRRL